MPATFGLLQGQPVPLFPGVQPESEVAAVLDQLLQAAIQNGITGRVELGQVPGAEDGDDLPPLHQTAFDAIERGDLPAAVAAYEQALAENPKDHDAELGLAQVRLMQRTQGVDLAAARAAAAADPADVEAAITVADLDVLGGHVEDAFTRLLDLVRTLGRRRARPRPHAPARALQRRRQPRRAGAQGPYGPDERALLTWCRPSSSTTTSGSGSPRSTPT